MASPQKLGLEVSDHKEWYDKYMVADSNALDEDRALILAVATDELDVSLIGQLI